MKSFEGTEVNRVSVKMREEGHDQDCLVMDVTQEYLHHPVWNSDKCTSKICVRITGLLCCHCTGIVSHSYAHTLIATTPILPFSVFPLPFRLSLPLPSFALTLSVFSLNRFFPH